MVQYAYQVRDGSEKGSDKNTAGGTMGVRMIGMTQTWWIMFGKIAEHVGDGKWDFELVAYTRKQDKMQRWFRDHETNGRHYGVWCMCYDVVFGLYPASNMQTVSIPVQLHHSILNVTATSCSLAFQEFVRMAIMYRPKERTPHRPEDYDRCIVENNPNLQDPSCERTTRTGQVVISEERATECLRRAIEKEMER